MTSMIKIKWNLGPMLGKLRQSSRQLETEIVRETGKELIRRTPVVTGTLRGSWDIGLGNASLRRIVRRASYAPPADAEGVATLERIMRKEKTRRPGQNVSFQNRAQYADVLEQRGSLQKGGPRGSRGGFMVAKTAANWHNVVRRARARVKGLS